MTEIRIVNLQKEYKDVTAVRDLTITFPSGEVTCLLGPSGCGKTTLMRMIAGLEEPTRGDIYFDDVCVTKLAPSKRNIGMVFQYPVVYRGLNVYRNIELPMIEDKLPESERKSRILEVAEIMGIQDSLDQDITQLDNSTRQKVAVARAVARRPKIILFDEPITNVDVNSKDQLKEALKRLTRQLHQTIVYVTHDQTEAMTLADQIALMRDGVILQRDTPRELYNHPNDVFGGWFLGNPGMSFTDLGVKAQDGKYYLDGGVFARTVQLTGEVKDEKLTLGVRPEQIKVYDQPNPQAVPARVLRKTIVVGGQILTTLPLGER
ncbi:ABC transporter ATP-binding protein, partial [bacterium]